MHSDYETPNDIFIRQVITLWLYFSRSRQKWKIHHIYKQFYQNFHEAKVQSLRCAISAIVIVLRQIRSLSDINTINWGIPLGIATEDAIDVLISKWATGIEIVWE